MILPVAFLCAALPATAQDPAHKVPDPASAVFTAGIHGLGSVQPGGYESPNSPYLSRNLGGVRAGAAFSLERSRRGQPLVALEISTTLPFEAVQSGRFVRPSESADCPPVRPCTATASHRDTLLSLLIGWSNNETFVLNLGPSVVLGKTAQGEARYDDAAGHWALTAGLDGVSPVGRRIDLVVGGRYSYAFRGPSQDFVGLGNHIFRLALGLRVRLTRYGSEREGAP